MELEFAICLEKAQTGNSEAQRELGYKSPILFREII